MGKLLDETMRRGREESLGKDGEADSSWERSARRDLRQARARGV